MQKIVLLFTTFILRNQIATTYCLSLGLTSFQNELQLSPTELTTSQSANSSIAGSQTFVNFVMQKLAFLEAKINEHHGESKQTKVNFDEQLDTNASGKSIEGVWSQNFNADLAVIGGSEPLGAAYVCRVKTPNGQVTVGKIHTNGCYYANGTNEYLKETFGSYEVLLSEEPHYAWVPKSPSNGATEDGMVEGGLTLSNEKTFVCRGFVVTGRGKVFLPGNLIPSQRQCWIPFHGGHATVKYEVLVDRRFGFNAFVSNLLGLRPNIEKVYNRRTVS